MHWDGVHLLYTTTKHTPKLAQSIAQSVPRWVLRGVRHALPGWARGCAEGRSGAEGGWACIEMELNYFITSTVQTQQSPKCAEVCARGLGMHWDGMKTLIPLKTH